MMENRFGLFGDTSSTQSAIIVPMPGDPKTYFIITADDLDTTSVNGPYVTEGLCYSIVDLNLNNGSGSIITKNESLLDSTLEKISVVKHINNTDYWLIAHEWGNSNFYAWQISEIGISDVPILAQQGILTEFIWMP